MIEYNKDKPLRLFEICAGYGSQALALKRLHKLYPEFCFELTGWCDYDPESSLPLEKQPAVVAHNALHEEGIGKNLGDLTKIDWTQVPDFDLLTASTPCQSISNAGLQHGFTKDSGTRSSIIWNVHDCVRIKRPRFIVMENVSAILSDKFKPMLLLWISELEKFGYTNFCPPVFTRKDGSQTRKWCLNAKDYGIAQNRERWFMVSILDENARYEFPKPFPLTKRLKDVLEKEVDERYYLSEERVRELVGNIQAGDSKTIAAMRGRSDGEWFESEHSQRLEQRTDGVTNSITSVAKDNMVVEPAEQEVLGWVRDHKGNVIKRPTVDVANCVTSGKRDNTMNYVKEQTIINRPHGYFPQVERPEITGALHTGAQGEYFVKEQTVLNADADGNATTVTTAHHYAGNIVNPKRGQKEMGVLEIPTNKKHQQDSIQDENGISRCLVVGCHGNSSHFSNTLTRTELGFRVRRLTERELFRLMDVDDADIDKIQAAGISKTQQAKMAGNSIVVSCLYHIFRKMFINTDIEKKQLELF